MTVCTNNVFTRMSENIKIANTYKNILYCIPMDSAACSRCCKLKQGLHTLVGVQSNLHTVQYGLLLLIYDYGFVTHLQIPSCQDPCTLHQPIFNNKTDATNTQQYYFSMYITYTYAVMYIFIGTYICS